MSTELARYIAEKFYANDQDLWGSVAEAGVYFLPHATAHVPHEAIEQILSDPACYQSELRLVHEGIGFETNYITSRHALEQFVAAHQASLVFPNLQRRDEWLSNVCYDVTKRTKRGIFTSAFYTPPGQQTLNIHWDPNAGAALQMMGRKRWWVYRPVIQTLNEIEHSRELTREEEQSHFVASFVVDPGDVVFIPRGWPHYASTEGEEVSFHITFGAIHRDIQHRFENT